MWPPDCFHSQCVAPVMVSTNMTNMRASCVVKSSAQFAREALNTVGYCSHTSGCLSHALQVRGSRSAAPPARGTKLTLLFLHPAERSDDTAAARVAPDVLHRHQEPVQARTSSVRNQREGETLKGRRVGLLYSASRFSRRVMLPIKH